MLKKTLHFSVWSRIIAAGLLFWALDNHEYGYYIFLRWTTCGVAAYFAYVAYENSKNIWTWILGVMALIFNPIIPFHLDRSTWFLIDLISGGLMLLSLFFVAKPVKARYSDDTGAGLNVKKVITSDGLQKAEGRQEGREELLKPEADKGPRLEAPKPSSQWGRTPGDIVEAYRSEWAALDEKHQEANKTLDSLRADLKTAKGAKKKEIKNQIDEIQANISAAKAELEDRTVMESEKLLEQAEAKARERGLVDEDQLDDFLAALTDEISDAPIILSRNAKKKVSDIFEEVLRDYIEAPIRRH